MEDIKSTTSVDIEESEFPITNYICAGTCTNYGVRDQLNASCNNDKSNYGGAFVSSIQDPSLKCILNMNSEAAKDMYDYSDYFKVNKNLCRVYCSDEVEYYIADKVKERSGRVFKYDIDGVVNGRKTVTPLLSSIIKERRTCVSEIYYGRIPFPSLTEIKKQYGLTNSEIAGVSNWTNLYALLYSKASSEGERAENINQIIYDLYNCNLYSQNVFNSNGITKPKENKTGNLRTYITELYGASNNYGLSDMGSCNINTTNGINTCVTHNPMTYNFGALPDGTKAEFASTTENIASFENMTYCSGSECFRYDNTVEDSLSYNYPKSTDRSETNKTIGNQTTSYTINSSKMQRWFGGRSSITIPTNDYVMFDIVTTVGFYNKSEYQTEPSTGNVIKKGSKVGRYITLDKYSFPVSKNAYNSENCTKLDENYSRCTVVQELGQVSTFYRKSLVDIFASKVYSTKQFTCYVDVNVPEIIINTGPPGSGTTRYRNVDPKDLYPNNLTVSPNWDTAEGRQARSMIEITASNNMLLTDDLLEYRVTITPTQLRNIKRYNKSSGDYTNEELVNCNNDGTMYYDCQSTFMNMLREQSTSGQSSYGTLDENYTGKSKYSNSKH